VGHICTSDMQEIYEVVQELGIYALCGGHCHEVTVLAPDAPVIVQAGSYLRGYVRLDLAYDPVLSQVTTLLAVYQPNPPGKTDKALAKRVLGWREHADPALWQPIGYLGTKIDNHSAEMGRLLASAWLDAYPQAQLILASPRYIHSLPAGELSPASVLSMLPTDNTLVHLQLTGQQVLAIVAQRRPVVGGSVSLEAVDPTGTYEVLVPDVLYAGGNNYQLRAADPAVRDTGIPWREPLIQWIAGLGTSRSHPLEKYLVEN